MCRNRSGISFLLKEQEQSSPPPPPPPPLDVPYNTLFILAPMMVEFVENRSGSIRN